MFKVQAGLAMRLCTIIVSTAICVHVGGQGPRKNSGSHIDASHSRQPLVKGERLVRYEVNAVMAYGAIQHVSHV